MLPENCSREFGKKKIINDSNYTYIPSHKFLVLRSNNLICLTFMVCAVGSSESWGGHIYSADDEIFM